MCDVSDYTVRVVLGQRVGRNLHVIYYTSMTVYDIEKEMLTVVFAIENFRSYLISCKIIMFIDHATLKYFFTRKDTKVRLIRWVLLLHKFDFEFKDKKCIENIIVDHFSRINCETIIKPLSLNESFPDEQLISVEVLP